MNKDLAEFHCGYDCCELKLSLAIYHTFNVKYVQQTEALANGQVSFLFVSPASTCHQVMSFLFIERGS